MAAELLFSRTHEWVKVDGDIATMGLTEYAQGELGDIVFIEVPEVDDEVDAEDSIGSIESVKTVSDYYCPVSGVVTEVNDSLEDFPEHINEDPTGQGWILRIKMKDRSELEELMDKSDYEFYLKQLQEEEE